MPLQRRRFIRTLLYASCCLVVVFVLFGGKTAAQGAAAIAQGFKTSETNLTSGALMSLQTGSNNSVELANVANVERLAGVVGNENLLELGNDTDNTQVVTSGTTFTLVSDVNGSVNAGDKITASPIDGIGMKATTSTQVVGTAQANLNSVTTQTRLVGTSNGSQIEVHIGKIPVQVNVTFYEAPATQTYLPSFLQSFANTVGGKEVAPVRVMLAALVLLLAFLSVAVLLYSTVRSSIISLGRNPLSEKVVRKSILRIGITVVGILLLTLITIYLILTT